MPAGSAKPAEKRPVPAGDSRRREMVFVASALCVAAVLVVGPALALRGKPNAGVLSFTLGPAVAFGLEVFFVNMANARGATRRLSPTSRYLTARTWTGMRTIDLRDLRSAGAWVISGGRSGGSTVYVIVTDSAGVRMSFTRKKDLELIRNAVRSLQTRKNAPPVVVSSLAERAIGLKPRSRGQEALAAFGSILVLLFGWLVLAGIIAVLAL